jgi:hypothetical protein
MIKKLDAFVGQFMNRKFTMFRVEGDSLNFINTLTINVIP